MSASKRYIVAERSFIGAGKMFTELAKAGELDKDEIATVNKILKQGDVYLDSWHNALDANEPYVDAETSFNWVLGTIEEFLKAKGQ